MADISEFYPPNPENVPDNLTAPSGDYKSRVTIVLLSLVLFVLLYVGLVAGSGYLAYYSFSKAASQKPAPAFRPPAGGPNSRSRVFEEPAFWYIVAGIPSCVLCLFFVKGFFKRQKRDPELMLEIQREDQPRLFAFIDRVCDDANAPEPHKIFLSPDVNACVFYNQSFWSLFRSEPKNLLIGLGLVNRLNLTEFKAVLAHEFGHFSQSSMKLGTYVYTANAIVADIVYGRDKLDDFLDAMKKIDLRIGIFFYAFSAVLWILRKFLELIFKAVNFANFSLSRQMEFNADHVAVSVTGSDALIFALAKLDFAAESLSQAAGDLATAADHKLYTKDLFYHQTCAMEYLRRVRKDPNLGEPPALPKNRLKTVEVFKEGDEATTSMWSTHPTNYDREQNAKEVYIRGVVDERSPWVLIANKPELREKMTRRFYRLVHRIVKPALTDPQKVQEFIDNEHDETTYDPRYHGLFDTRYIRPGDIDELKEVALRRAERKSFPARTHEQLFGEALKARSGKHREREGEQSTLLGMSSGQIEWKKDFEFRGEEIRRKDIPSLLMQIHGEMEADYEHFAKTDREMVISHLQMAYAFDEPAAEELIGRYRFHLKLQELIRELTGRRNALISQLSAVQGKEMQPGDFKNLVKCLRETRDEMATQLTRASGMTIPALKNMEDGRTLSVFLLDKPLVAQILKGENSIDGEVIGTMLEQLGTMIGKGERIHFKSLGNILAIQERLERKYREGLGEAAPQKAAEAAP